LILDDQLKTIKIQTAFKCLTGIFTSTSTFSVLFFLS